MSELENAFRVIEGFSNPTKLTKRISDIESQLQLKDYKSIICFLQQEGIKEEILEGALKIKGLVGQINVLIHTLGILNVLPYIIEEDEEILYVSLGAGNTGKKFDLETNKRIAEFKFIQWKGGSEAIRQNSLFIDFFNLAEHASEKTKCLYVINKKYPTNFLNGNRALKSVLSKNQTASTKFYNKYGNKYKVVSEYFRDFNHLVKIIDMKEFISVF